MNSATNQKYTLEDNLLFMSTPSSNVSRFSTDRLFQALNLLEFQYAARKTTEQGKARGRGESVRSSHKALLSFSRSPFFSTVANRTP